MRLLLCCLLCSTGCHVAVTTATTTVTTKVVTLLFDGVLDAITFNREFDARWAQMQAEWDQIEREQAHVFESARLREGISCPTLEACR